MQAIWKEVIIAESDDTIIIENNHYFPPESLKKTFFKPSSTKSVCGWKGEASYYSVDVNGSLNQDAAWFYSEPKSAASEIKDYVAFWRGVEVKE